MIEQQVEVSTVLEGLARKRPSYEDSLWSLTRAHLDSLEPDLADAVVRCAIVHWFDENVLEAVLGHGRLDWFAEPVKSRRAAELYESLRALPFVEEHSAGAYALHSATRKTILEQLWLQKREHYQTVSSAAAEHFSPDQDGSADVNDFIERFYHLLVVDESKAMEFGAGFLEAVVRAGESGLGHAILVAAQEHIAARRVSDHTRWQVALWSVQVAFGGERYADTVQQAREIYESQEDVPIWIRAEAARIAARGLMNSASYGEAFDWIERARHPNATTTEAADDLLTMAAIRHAQGQHQNALTYCAAALDTLGPALIVSDDADSPQDNDSAQHAGTSADPHDWSYTDDALFVAEGANTMIVGGNGERVLRKVQPSPLLAAIWSRVASIAFVTDDFARAHAAAMLAARIAVAVDDTSVLLAASRVLYDVGGEVGDPDMDDAICDSAASIVELAEQNDDERAQIEGLLLLGLVYVDRIPDIDKSTAAFDRALEIARKLGDAHSQARAHDGSSRVAFARHDFPSAREHVSRGLALLKDRGYRETAAYFLLRAADLAFSSFAMVDAAHQYGEALSMFRELEDRFGQFRAHIGLAGLARYRHEHVEATRHFEQAIAIAATLRSKSLVAEALCDLAMWQLNGAAPGAAAANVRQAAALYEERGGNAQEGELLLYRGAIASAVDNLGEALEALTRARDLFRDLRRSPREQKALGDMAELLRKRGNLERAVAVGEEARELARTLKDRTAELDAIHTLAVIYSESGRHSDGIRSLEEVLLSEPDDPRVLVNLGWLHYLAGDYEESIVYSERALKLDAGQTYALRNLGHAHLALGNPDQAEGWYRAAIEQRHDGETFEETIAVIRKLVAERPNTARATEFLALFEKTDREIGLTYDERDKRAQLAADARSETLMSVLRH